MSEQITVSVKIPHDENGMIGRECLICKKYFKIKPGTGLPTTYCHCPYCDYSGESDTFWTTAQYDYVKSIAIKQSYEQFVKSHLEEFVDSFKEIERSTRNSLIQIKVEASGINYSIPIKYFTEEDLETTVTCDNCGLVFSVYGVFAQCPDCNEHNAFLIYEKSLEVIQKQFDIILNPYISHEIKENSNIFILYSCISAFDGLGKELRKRRPDLYTDKPKNLFQNLLYLNNLLNNFIKYRSSDFDFLIKMFQVRHAYEHNMGVIDEEFIQKLPEYSKQLGRKYILKQDEIEMLLLMMRELGNIMK